MRCLIVEKLSHFELCGITAKRFLSESDIVLFEYKSFASNEEPDVLCYKGNYTKLFEIKISRSDFQCDSNKACRTKYKNVSYPYLNGISQRIKYRNNVKKCLTEAPHLGSRRYYVCPPGLIQPEEVGGWGLYRYNGRFFKKKESEKFQRNIFAELALVSHAFRKYIGIKSEVYRNILIKPY